MCRGEGWTHSSSVLWHKVTERLRFAFDRRSLSERTTKQNWRALKERKNIRRGSLSPSDKSEGEILPKNSWIYLLIQLCSKTQSLVLHAKAYPCKNFELSCSQADRQTSKPWQ